MAQTTAAVRASVYPCLAYQDAPAAIDWLGRAFGLSPLIVVPGTDGKVEHAELAIGSAVVMMGSEKEGPMGFRSPKSLGGPTHAVYICLDEVDALYERARAAGAEIVQTIQDEDYGSRGYGARDPEGHLWYFGTYAPEAK